MRYCEVSRATFVERPNRFIAVAKMADGSLVRTHVKNTGRCAELLVPGATVYLVAGKNPLRKTPFDLVAVEKQTEAGTRLINMDSAAPNAVAKEWLQSGGLGTLDALKPEYTLGKSRLDFYAVQDGRQMLVEVKGCTLEENGLARFPDAPTLRGLKHVHELTEYAKQGWRCVVLIVIQMKGIHRFIPNWDTQPAFGEALQAATAAGVEVRAVDCVVTPASLAIDAPVTVDLTSPVALD